MRLRSLLLGSACLLLLLNSISAKQIKAWSGLLDDTDGRLPTDLRPYHYNVELLPYVYFDQPPLPFNGHVDIYFECLSPTNVVTINNDGLTIDGSSIVLAVATDSPGNPATPSVATWEHDQPVNFLHFNLASQLEVGARYVLSMEFTGTLGLPSAGQGLYWDSYVDESGTTVYIAATQGESIFARKAFPCFDEPDLKSTFNITIVRRSHFVSFANTPLIRSEPRPDDFIADIFGKSPVMSSYQLCIVVGDFVETFSGSANGVDVRILSRPQMKRYMQMAADIATELQVWLETITQQPYPLPKMDHIALPSKGGAMENYGLITYGEPSIAYDPETSGVYYRLNLASIVSHELAHQWYGNLVTCKWWDDIWLNEGFATHYNYQPTTVLGWDPDENQQIDPRRGVMQFLDIDCRNNSDPIRKDISNVWLAPSAFSGSTYPKGGAMLRMLLGILTNDTLNKGLQRYLTTMQYQGAVTDDLWAALTAQAAADGLTNPDGSPLDVGERMNAWLNQMGYPLVHVHRNPDGTVTASRTQFLNPRNQVMNTPSDYGYVWHVPLTVVTSQSGAGAWDAPPVDWIDIQQTETVLRGLTVAAGDWLIVNSKARGFYRVHYDDVSRAAIIDQLNVNHVQIESQTRASFIDDLFSLARTGYISETDAMEATRYLSEEFQYNPWYPTVKHLTSAERLLGRETWFSSYRAYVLGLTVPVYGTVQWQFPDGETPLQQYLRRDIIDLTCSNGYNDCVDRALQYYYAARDNPHLNTVNPNVLPTVLCTGIMTFINDWELWYDQYRNRMESQIPDERYSFLFGLACTNYPSNLELYLQALIGDGIASRDKSTAAGYLAGNSYGAILLWDYLDNNWDSPAFSSKFTTLRTIVEGMHGENSESQLSGFISRHPPTSQSEENLYQQMTLTLQQNNNWLDANRDSIRDWLQAKSFRDNDWLDSHMRRPFPISPARHWANVAHDPEDIQP